MSSGHGAFLGVDVGTSSVKAGLVGTDGRIIALVSQAVPLERGPSGRAEQDLHAVWRAVSQAIAETMAARGEAAVLAVGVTGQGDGAWFVDRDGAPVGPAATWMDGRARGLLEEWRANGNVARMEATTWSSVFPGVLPLLASWWERERPAEYARARWHLNVKDWIGFRLTGQIATDPTEAARVAMPMAQWPEGPFDYDRELLADVGVASLVDRLAPILPSDAVRGEVTPDAARLTGIPAGTPVVMGVIDGVAVAMGMGATADGDGFAILGTTGSYGCVSPVRPTMDQVIGVCLPNGVGSSYHAALAPASGAPTLDWLRNLLGPGMSFDALEELARQSPPGARGLMFLPHLSQGGERAPFVEPAMRGAAIGLTFETSRADLARAVYEGMAFVLAECLDALPPVTGIALGGGGARSTIFPEIAADVTGVPVRVMTDGESGVLGIAGLAAASTGATLPPPQVDRVWEPQGSNAAAYAAVGERTRQARAAVREQLRHDAP